MLSQSRSFLKFISLGDLFGVFHFFIEGVITS